MSNYSIIQKPILLLILALGLLNCKHKMAIDQQKVVEILTQYGKENPENQIIIKTNLGEVAITLFDQTPLHRANFIRNIKLGYYQDRNFYRIVKGVCLQGGSRDDPQPYTIPAEFGPNLLNTKGAISMARYTENNPNKESSATEFFIITKGKFYNAEDLSKYSDTNRKLYLEKGGEMLFDNQYTTFGQVTKGLDIIEKLAKTNLMDKETPNRPLPFSIELAKF